MSGPGWRVPEPEAESVRRRLRAAGCLRPDREVRREPGFVTFPLEEGPGVPTGLPGAEVRADFSPRRPPASGDYRRGGRLPPELAERAPRAFDVVGDIVLVRIPSELDAAAPAIGAALLQFVPSARLVVRDEGVHGWERTRRLVSIAGEGPLRTIHRENGLPMAVDLGRAYFSPRLGREHLRVARAVGAGEAVLDLCCGIGPFALTIASRGVAQSIRAVDANPAAIDLLRENQQRLRIGDRIEPICARLEEYLPSARVADRVIFNLPREGIKYLASVGNAVAPAGTLHFYEMTERALGADRANDLRSTLPDPAHWRVVEVHPVHPFSPHADLVAYTFQRSA